MIDENDRAAAPKFPVFSISLAVSLTIICILSQIGLGVYFHQAKKEIYSKYNEIIRANVETVWLDEALTMSARLAAASGDPVWIERYNGFLDPMDSALARQADLAPAALAAKVQSETESANTALVDLETRALAYVEAGDLSAARPALRCGIWPEQGAVDGRCG